MEMKQLILGSDRDAAHAMTVMPSVEEGKEAGQQLSPAAQNRGRKKRRKIRYVLAALAICLATSGGLASFLPQAEVFRSKLRETRKRSKSRISGTGQ